ncbi:MAG: polysaccharide pyruvyl transferase family protein [Hamadaea sp.]|uniref:polysaccharide pyruvyl transferase family protein n=1 Tax=Hamadaea sp. TaxID=2024425 RepID=UPI0017ED83A5|nr:polysaccharide pyruvyl transferase family protein [Hamadaea sp.]NUT22827.1 polysaccharide pyruvyl transferase family protein [Hamadaea sp.]
MKTGIVGWFGSDNLGDEILLHSLMHNVSAAAGGSEFVVFSPNPDRVAQLHGVQTAPMPTLRGGGLADRTKQTIALLRECDLLVFGPGTVFQERSPNLPWPGTLPLFARITGMAKFARTPVAAVGVGVREGGTAFGRSLLRSFGTAALAVGTRDRRSANHFGPRAAVIGDMAYAVDLPAPAAPALQPRFAVSMRPLAPETQKSLTEALRGCAESLQADGWEGDFLAMAYGRDANGEDDREIYAADFAAGLALGRNPLDSDQLIRESLDSWLTGLGAYRVVLGTRLHAALMAVAMGVPTVAIAYERKVRDAFVDLGLSDFLVGPNCTARDLRDVALRAAAAPEVFAEARTRVIHQGSIARDFIAAMVKRLR